MHLFIILSDQVRYINEKFNKWEFNKQRSDPNGYTVAVPSELSVKKLFEIKQALKELDIKITQQNKKWNDALKKILRKKD